MLTTELETGLEIYKRRSFDFRSLARSKLMLPLVKPVCSLDVCNELAASFTNQNAIKILSKLSVSGSENIVFSGVWKVLGLIMVLPDMNATSERSFSALKRVKNVFAYN